MSSGHHPILSSLFETPDSNHLLTNEDEVIKEEDETAEEEKVEEIIQAEEERGSWDSKVNKTSTSYVSLNILKKLLGGLLVTKYICMFHVSRNI